MASPIHEFTHLPRRNSASTARSSRRGDDGARRSKAGPCVGLIYNPRSHRNKGKDLDSRIAPDVIVAQPGDRSQLPEELARLAEKGIDLLVINGGDGTVRDVLTCGDQIFADDWPTLAVLPKGKTNALTVDLDAPNDWTLQAAIDAYENGRRIRRCPMAVSPKDQPNARVLGFIMGAGAFTMSTRAGQSAHKLGAFNSLAVAVTAIWAVLQTLFGSLSNPWRRGAQMDIRLAPDGVPLSHSGAGDADRRQLLFASTLERFPAGLKPFGSLKKGLKLAILDQVSRRVAMMLPAVLLGWPTRKLRDRGLHQLAVTAFDIELDDQFILDGEAFPAGIYRVEPGPELEFVAP